MRIGGFDFINDASGLKLANGQPFWNAGYAAPSMDWRTPGSWGEVNQILKMGDTNVLLPEFRPYAKEIENFNDQVAATENYDTGFGAGGWVPGAILGLGLAGGLGLLGGASGAAGGGATGAFDMGIGGIGEAMGLGSGGTAAASSGGSMWDFIDQLIGANPDIGAENMFGFEANPWGEALRDLSPLGSPTNLQDKITAFDTLLGNNTGMGMDAAKALLGNLGGGANADILKGLLSSRDGGMLGGILNDPLGSAFNATPFLLALAQANKQGDDIDNVLGQINTEGYTKSVLDPYDLQTNLGRNALQQDLGNRGVAGSSFGYTGLDNYDYMRGLGRGDLASKAGLTSAALQGQLINNRNTNTNLLLGAGLNASGRLFSPQKDPFNLAALLGG